jgi:predicted transcriptional regulator
MNEPKIKITEAIDAAGGRASHLAKALGISRSAVSMWSSEGNEYVPILQAYRLQAIYPERFGNKSAA